MHFNQTDPVSDNPRSCDNQVARTGTGLLCAKKLTVPEAAKVMCIGQTKLRELLRKGDIPVIRIMGKILLVEGDLEAFMQRSYGPLKVVETKSFNRLPALPAYVTESPLLKKVCQQAQ